jgi:hypothetical protein
MARHEVIPEVLQVNEFAKENQMERGELLKIGS